MCIRDRNIDGGRNINGFEEWNIKQELKEFRAFADRTDKTGSKEKHRVTQHIKDQKGGK